MDTFARRLFSLVFAVILFVYVGYQVYQATYTSVEVEDAISYTVHDTVDTNAFVVRDETIIGSSKQGHIYYSLANGDRVAKGGQIAQIFSSESDALAFQRQNKLDAQIEILKTIHSQGGYNRTNLDLINNQLSAQLKSLSLSTIHRRYTDLADLEFSLLQLFLKQQLTIGSLDDLSTAIEDLQAQRNAIGNNVVASSVVSSPVAGYFISQVDGLENVIDYRKALTVMPSEVDEALSATANPTDVSIGKVAGDYQWYLLCVLNNEQINGIGVGKKMSILLPFVSAESIPVTIAAVNKDRTGRAAVVMECINMSKDIAAIRREPIQIQMTEYKGLYVQDSALQFNDNNETGVFVRVGNTCVFRKVEVLYHSDTGKYSVCAEKQDSSYLQLYDDIIVKGKGLYDGKIIR